MCGKGRKGYLFDTAPSISPCSKHPSAQLLCTIIVSVELGVFLFLFLFFFLGIEVSWVDGRVGWVVHKRLILLCYPEMMFCTSTCFIESLILCDGVSEWWWPHVSHTTLTQIQASQSKVYMYFNPSLTVISIINCFPITDSMLLRSSVAYNFCILRV